MLFELPLNSSAKSFGCYFEEVFHAGLRVDGVDVGVSPDRVEYILDLVNKRGDLPQFKSVNLRERLHNFVEMLVNQGGLISESLILVGSYVLALIFEPALDFVHRT